MARTKHRLRKWPPWKPPEKRLRDRLRDAAWGAVPPSVLKIWEQWNEEIIEAGETVFGVFGVFAGASSKRPLVPPKKPRKRPRKGLRAALASGASRELERRGLKPRSLE